MGLFGRKEQRDDMYALQRGGEDVDLDLLEGKRMGQLDRPHIFQHDVGGEILPASLIKSKKNPVAKFRGKTLRLGTAHSHDGAHHDHYLENMAERPTDLLGKFRKAVKVFHRGRQKKRDQG